MRNVVRSVLKALLRLIFRVQVHGLAANFQAEKLLIISNHASFLDGWLIGFFLPFDPVFVVHTHIARQAFFRFVLRLADYVVVDTSSPLAIKQIVRLVDQGRPVVIFPEGRITITGALMKVYDGPAFVATKTGATILPVCLSGSVRTYFSYMSGKIPRRLFPQITITVLPPETLTMPEAATAKLRRRKAGNAMQKLMQRMLFHAHRPQTVYSALLEAMSIYGPRRRVLEDIQASAYRYRDVLKMCVGLGIIIAKHSQIDECVGILMPNVAVTIGMLIGASARGRVPVMLNYKAGTAGMQDACITSKIRTVFTSRAFLSQAKLEVDVVGLHDIQLLYLEDLRVEFNWWNKLLVIYHMLFPRSFEKLSDTERSAVVLFTSGSEGKPKGVVLSHRALLANVSQIQSVIDLLPQDKVLNILPLFHSFGLMGGALLPLLTGMNVFLYPNPLHYRIIPEIAYDRNCTVLFGTSSFLAQYAQFAHPYDFYRLRYVVAGAEKLTDAVRKLWFEKFGLRIFEGYGVTETAPVLAVNTPMAYRSGTVGQLLPCVEHQVIPVPGMSQGGVLHVRGPNLLSGYYRYEAPGVLQAPVSSVGLGWYDTGDIVQIDEDGFIQIVGRVKRFAKIAGEMVSLAGVEALATHAAPTGLHAAVTVADATRGEMIVLLTTATSMTRNMLLASARILNMPELAIPKRIQLVGALPLLGTGKTDYEQLKRMVM